jgi:cytoskeletal protein RodZ
VNGFIKKSVGTLTLGEKLKKLRSERRVSLNDVSRITKVQLKYLESLEEGRYDELPADVYIRGFLKSYADFFGLNKKVLIRLFEKERGIKNNLAKNGKEKEDKKNTGPISVSFISLTPKKTALGLIFILALAVIIFIYKELGSFASVPELAVLSPENNSQVEGNSVTVSGVTEKDARLFINGQPILINDEGKFLENLTLQSGPNTINIKSINRFNKEAQETLTVNSKIEENNLSDASEQQNKEDVISNDVGNTKELILELKVDPGPVWLSVEADGSLVFSGTMLSGAVQAFKAQQKIVVNSGKGNATLVKFNGKDMGKLSENSGAARGIVFDKDSN